MDPIAQTTHPIPLILRAIRNDSLEVRLRLYNARTARPVVLTGYSGTASIFAAVNSDVATHQLEVDVDQAGAGLATTGMVTVELAPAQSTTWLEDGYWALVLTDGSVRKTIIAGPWEMRGPSLPGPGFACGLCPVPGLDLLGVDCDVLRHGYTIVRLPAPQPECCSPCG